MFVNKCQAHFHSIFSLNCLKPILCYGLEFELTRGLVSYQDRYTYKPVSPLASKPYRLNTLYRKACRVCPLLSPSYLEKNAERINYSLEGRRLKKSKFIYMQGPPGHRGIVLETDLTFSNKFTKNSVTHVH